MRLPDQESILELDKLDPDMQLPEIGEMNEDGFDAYSLLEPPFQKVVVGGGAMTPQAGLRSFARNGSALAEKMWINWSMNGIRRIKSN
ncbi:MAG: hypothetical protein K0R67_3474 [Paenibacillus sp.]|jgi:hypothetical protein|nr:hypothetical protein [Paenibacillus sp.]